MLCERASGDFLVILVITLNVSFLLSKPIYQRGKFPYMKCKQDNRDVRCEAVNTTGRNSRVSLWPPGPFAIPMSRHGCPEAAYKGWKQGFINITSSLGHSWRQKFCSKIRNDPILDRGSWVSGNYSIYKAGKTCPEGFNEFFRTKSYIDFIHFGHLPNFTLYNESGTTNVQFYLCEPESTSHELLENTSMFWTLETEFLLGKIKDIDCPWFNGSTTEGRLVNGDMNKTYCSYTPRVDDDKTDNYPQLATQFIMSKGTIPYSELISAFLTSAGSLSVTPRCQPGWILHNVRCYFVSNTKLTWEEARATCKTHGGDLVEINDAEENIFLSSKVFGNKRYWTGLTNISGEGFIYTASGKNAVYSNFSYEVGVDSSNKCVTIGRGDWFYENCNDIKRFICESKDKCKPNPCLNGGVCKEVENNFMCTCAVGFHGASCDVLTSQSQTMWYQLDMQRTLSVYKIKITINSTGKRQFHTSMYTACFYDDVSWSFLYLEGSICNEEIEYVETILTLHLGNVQSRFITILLEEREGFPAIQNVHFVKVFLSHLPDSDICNMDLGMTDGTIQDFQITASSWHPQHLPSAARPLLHGWCADIKDIKPWILVDLVADTIVEGISILNRENLGCSSFYLYYGTELQTLLSYNDTKFDIDLSKPFEEEQTFILLAPVKTRYIKLEIVKGLKYAYRCLQFELRGCKLSGVPTLNCFNASELFGIGTEIWTKRETNWSKLSSNNSDTCFSLCLQNRNCSVVNYNTNGQCIQYMPSYLGQWKVSENVSGHWAAKLCAADSLNMLPSLTYTDGTVVTNIDQVYADAIISSVGYPLSYGNGQQIWAVQFPNQRYIRLVFTNVSINYQDEQFYDRLYISTTILVSKNSRQIDRRYEKRIFVVETSESKLFLIFTPCSTRRRFTTEGFRAIITGEDVPACLSVNSEIAWHEGRNEVCNKPKMVLTSMSILNLPFIDVEERWEIQTSEHYNIHIMFTEFYVVCPYTKVAASFRWTERKISSRFSVVDDKEYIFCNTIMPPEVFTSKTSHVSVQFHMFRELSSNEHTRAEGFRLHYSAIQNSLEKLTDILNITKGACSVTFGKCYNVIKEQTTWDEAELYCWKLNQTLLSVQSKYEMQYVNYLLRDARYKDTIEHSTAGSNANDTSYMAHIGLRRYTNVNNQKEFLWENNSPITFAAWRSGHPMIKFDCSRTNFQYFEENTWETEQCTQAQARYVVCQSQMEVKMHEKELTQSPGILIYQYPLPFLLRYKVLPVRFRGGRDPCKGRVEIYLFDEWTTICSSQGLFGDRSAAVICRMSNCSTQGAVKSDSVLPGTGRISLDMIDCVGDETDVRQCKFTGYQISYCKHEWDVTVSCGSNDYCETVRNVQKSLNISYTEKECISWNKLTDDAKEDFLLRYRNLKIPTEAGNYCQDPSGSGILGCYTEDSVWEPCFFQLNAPGDRNDTGRTFECGNGTLIPISNLCDGVFNCKDYSDETVCKEFLKDHPLVKDHDVDITTKIPARFEKGSYHNCGSKEWISILAKCDGVIDCIDASDETNCSRTNNVCKEAEFSCGDGNCIYVSQVCDFIPDCADTRDEFCEFKPCELDEYTCDNTQCIPNDRRCNAIPDCIDESDESQCDFCMNAFHCDGKCISKRLVCDNYQDCEDSSDEKSCVPDAVKNCKDWWQLGYHTSGYYLNNGINFFCDFSSVHKNPGEIIMTNKNIDATILYYGDGRKTMSIFTRSVSSSRVPLGLAEFTPVLADDFKCFLKIRSTCKFAVVASMLGNDVQHCQCTDWTFRVLSVVFQESEARDKIGRINPVEQIYLENVNYTGCDGGRHEREPHNYFFNSGAFNTLIDPQPGIEITFRPYFCTHGSEIYKTEKTMDCQGTNQTIPLSMLCVSDIDETGYRVGCRSGSHLQNCSNFSCPNNLVKCPASYCIPRRFVCDGVVHCPEGEDEQNCNCAIQNKEVLILTEDTEYNSESENAAFKLARQLYITDSVIRLLHFKTQSSSNAFPIEYRLLDIRDERIERDRAGKRYPTCQYNTMARNFLQQTQFSKNDIKGVIFIEDSKESSQVANLMFANLSKSEVLVYRVIKEFSRHINNKPDRYRYVKDIRIIRWNALNYIGYKRFPEICAAEVEVPCSGGYRCLSSRECIPLEQVCDGTPQCRNKDDERLCDAVCPENCSCVGYSISCRATNLNFTDAVTLSRNTRSADLSLNIELKNVLTSEILRFPYMIKLNLSSCQIRDVSSRSLVSLYRLTSLDIGHNHITRLPDNLFAELRHLIYLNLNGNTDLQLVSPTTFQGLKSIRSLEISGTKLKRISSNTFSNLNLQSINISFNEIEEIENYAFNNTSVNMIDMKGNTIFTFNKLVFAEVTSLRQLHTPAFKFCCIRPCYVRERDCYPAKDEFSSCEDLMRHPILQAVLWLVGIAALLGNLGSIIYRLVYDRKRLKIGYGIFVTHLAAADFLMGVYLIIIAMVDSIYRNRYIFEDDNWRNSVWCLSAGVLSTLSSEASVLFLCLITLDRLLVIKYPFGNVRFEPRKAHISCMIVWIVGITLALIPVFYTSYFKNSFYSRSGVCIALPLTRDKPPGWIYSVTIFIGLNLCTFILVAFGQLSIFLELHKANRLLRKTQKARRTDLQVARNLILVATTDFLCWFPIGVMGIIALTGHPISGDVYAWTAVLILPLNSALNPVLYTLSAIIGKEKFNPSTEEQNRTELQREIGSGILQHKYFSRYIRMKGDFKHTDEAKSVHTMLDKKENIPAATVLAIAMHLSKYMSLLHESAIGIDNLSEHSTHIRMNKNRKHQVSFVLDWKTSLMSDEKKKHVDIYQFGILIRRLLSSYKIVHNRDK